VIEVPLRFAGFAAAAFDPDHAFLLRSKQVEKSRPKQAFQETIGAKVPAIGFSPRAAPPPKS
jgi:hypothetical protein